MWIITKAYAHQHHGAVPKENVCDYLTGLSMTSGLTFRPRDKIDGLADALPYRFRLLDSWGDLGYEGKTDDITSDDAEQPRFVVELQTAIVWKIEFLQGDGHTWKAFKEPTDVPQE